jgi:CPA1 family monovalent cation:H+ antiporter
MIHTIEVVFGLLVAVALIALVAAKLRVPLPILLVGGGLLLSLIPGLPRLRLDPEQVFFVILPPLLYPAALFMPWRDFQANLRPISLLAVGLVLFTTVSVGFLANYFISDLPLAAAFALGAIISPPDAVAATAITERLKVPRRVVTILNGESLVNDATALVAYRFAVAAVVTGSFSFAKASVQFLVVGLGGIVIGLVAGWITAEIQRRIDNPPIETTISILSPFAAYLPAEQFGVSGVLAVVTTGLYHGWRIPEITTLRSRLQGGPVWEMIEFLLNGFIFILIGLQLPDVIHNLEGRSINQLAWYAAVISLAVILIRIIWVFPATYLPRLVSKKMRECDPYPSWQNVSVVAWTGIRGVVSLAAALALPLTTHAGTPFPGRDLITFLTFVVILVTLVLQGLSLPPLIKWLKVHDDGTMEKEERIARLKANEAALAQLVEISENPSANSETLRRLRVEYEDRLRQLELEDSREVRSRRGLFSAEYEKLSRRALTIERETILQLRNERVINDEILRRIQRDIDLAEIRLQRSAD